jgi:hypothetical protein
VLAAQIACFEYISSNEYLFSIAFMVFDSWQKLMEFMLGGLDIPVPDI